MAGEEHQETGQHHRDDRASLERGDDRGPEGRIRVLERQPTLTLDQENGNGRELFFCAPSAPEFCIGNQDLGSGLCTECLSLLGGSCDRYVGGCNPGDATGFCNAKTGITLECVDNAHCCISGQLYQKLSGKVRRTSNRGPFLASEGAQLPGRGFQVERFLGACRLSLRD